MSFALTMHRFPVFAPGMGIRLWHLAQVRTYTRVGLGHAPSNRPPHSREDLMRFEPHQKPASREYYRLLDRAALGFIP